MVANNLIRLALKSQIHQVVLEYVLNEQDADAVSSAICNRMVGESKEVAVNFSGLSGPNIVTGSVLAVAEDTLTVLGISNNTELAEKITQKLIGL